MTNRREFLGCAIASGLAAPSLLQGKKLQLGHASKQPLSRIHVCTDMNPANTKIEVGGEPAPWALRLTLKFDSGGAVAIVECVANWPNVHDAAARFDYVDGDVHVRIGKKSVRVDVISCKISQNEVPKLAFQGKADVDLTWPNNRIPVFRCCECGRYVPTIVEKSAYPAETCFCEDEDETFELSSRPVSDYELACLYISPWGTAAIVTEPGRRDDIVKKLPDFQKDPFLEDLELPYSRMDFSTILFPRRMEQL